MTDKIHRTQYSNCFCQETLTHPAKNRAVYGSSTEGWKISILTKITRLKTGGSGMKFIEKDIWHDKTAFTEQTLAPVFMILEDGNIS